MAGRVQPDERFPASSAQTTDTSSRTQQFSTFHSWSRLPTEIQQQIVDLRLKNYHPITRKTHDIHMRLVFGSLLLANKNLSDLAKRAYYTNTFRIELEVYLIRGRSLWYPKPAIAKFIRKLELRILNMNVFRPGLRSDSNRRSIRKLDKLDWETPSMDGFRWSLLEDSNRSWQLGFINLEELKIEMKFHGDHHAFCCREQWFLAFEQELRNKALAKNAEKAEVVVEWDLKAGPLPIPIRSWPCEQDCAKRIANAVRDMVLRKREAVVPEVKEQDNSGERSAPKPPRKRGAAAANKSSSKRTKLG